MVRGVTHDKYAVEFWVDDEDAFLLNVPWHANFHRNGKLGAILKTVTGTNGRQLSVYLHRIVMKLPSGDGKIVDHADGNPANNTRSNLRICTLAENNRNCSINSNNTSGFKGVCWHKQHRKWIARIRVNNRQSHLGYFDTPEAAHEAYCAAAEKYFGEFARFE